VSKHQTRDRDSGPIKLGLAYGILLAIGFVRCFIGLRRIRFCEWMGALSK
jgi:hypothetical protein